MVDPDPDTVAYELAAVFARMSGLVLSNESITTALNLLVSLARETLPHAIGAGVTLIDPAGHKTTAAASDPVVAEADAVQYELDEGPCLSAWQQRSVMRIDDMNTERRWPHWVAQATPLGIWATLSAPMVTGDTAPGAIKVYADTPGAFDQHDEHVLSMFAAQAAVLIANLQSYEAARTLSEDLKAALRGREVIALAKGVLIGRDGADEGTALTTLAGMAAQRHATLRDTATATIQAALLRRRPTR